MGPGWMDRLRGTGERGTRVNNMDHTGHMVITTGIHMVLCRLRIVIGIKVIFEWFLKLEVRVG